MKQTLIKMKRAGKIVLCVFFMNSVSYASSTEDFFYNRGYELGYTAGYEKGVAEAFKEAKKVLERYKDNLYSYELGKYLIKTKKLTYPQVWQEKTDDNRVILKVMPSIVEKELDIDDLFNKFAVIPKIDQTPLDKLELTVGQKNSVNLSDRDSNINDLPQNVNTAANKQILRIKKNSRNLEILKRANVVFSDEDDSYNVLFFTKQEEKDFCKQFEICK